MLTGRAGQIALRSVDLTSLRAAAAERWQLLTLAGFVVLAAALRMVDVVDNPRGFFTDEASFGLNAHLIWTTGRDEHGEFLPLLFRSFGEYKLPVFVYAEVPFVAVLGRTEEAVRLTSAVIGSLTVATTYLLARELFRRELPALASAAFLAILPWHIHYSRTGLGDIVCLPLFFTLAAYLFLRATREEKYLIPCAIVFALTFYTYRAAWVVLPPLLLVMAVVYRDELWRFRKQALVAGGVFLLLVWPLAHHLLGNDSDRASQAWIFNLDRDQSTMSIFWEFYRSYFSTSFLFENADNWAITRHYLPGHGVLYWVQLPLILIGIAGMLVRFQKRYLLVLALIFLYPLSGALSDVSPISSRAILGSLTFALLSGAGLWFLVETARSWLPERPRLVTGFYVGGVALITLLSVAVYVDRYHSRYPSLSAGYWGWQDGPQDIVAYFLTQQDRYDELYMDGTFNAPHIFFDFYAPGDCDKCGIGGPERYDPQKRQLFALRPENIEGKGYEYDVIDRLLYPDGSTSFLFVEISGRP